MAKKKIFQQPKPGDLASDPLTQDELDEREKHENEAMLHERERELAAKLPRLEDAIVADAIESTIDADVTQLDLQDVSSRVLAFCDSHQAIAKANGHLSFSNDFNALRSAIQHINKHANRISYWKKVN